MSLLLWHYENKVGTKQMKQLVYLSQAMKNAFKIHLK